MAPETAVRAQVPGVPQEAADLRARQHQLLVDCDLLDVPEDAELDAVTRLASAVTGFPVAMINILETERACQLTSFGIPRMHAGRDTSLCNRASLIGGVVTSDECTTDPRFADLPWVDGRWATVRRYASAPLVVDGLTVGTLCIFDQQPGPALREADRDNLRDLAAVVVALLERRRHSRRTEAARRQLQQSHRELADSHAELARVRAFERALLDALPVAVVAAGADGAVTVLNDVARDWHGEGAAEALSARTGTPGTPAAEAASFTLHHPEDRALLGPGHWPLHRTFAEGHLGETEVVVAVPGRPDRTVSCVGAQVHDVRGQVVGAVLTMADVTARRGLEAELRLAATHDALTGLPNRSLLTDRLRSALDRAAGSGEPVAVLFCDLDGFKAVNDTHGHEVGDAVLVETASRLRAALRGVDTVARLGGDEFVVLCPEVATREQAEEVVARLQQAMLAPVSAAGARHRVRVSIGLALSGPGRTAEELLALADHEMYHAKRDRGDGGSRH